MSIEMGILTALVVMIVAILSFFAARMKDAEERGRLVERVQNLTDQQKKTEAKMDEILTKLDAIGNSITRLFTERRLEKDCQS